MSHRCTRIKRGSEERMIELQTLCFSFHYFLQIRVLSVCICGSFYPSIYFAFEIFSLITNRVLFAGPVVETVSLCPRTCRSPLSTDPGGPGAVTTLSSIRVVALVGSTTSTDNLTLPLSIENRSGECWLIRSSACSKEAAIVGRSVSISSVMEKPPVTS
jgi:hypothetical protein